MPVVTKRCYCSLVKGRHCAHHHQFSGWNLELRRVLDARKANPQEWGLWLTPYKEGMVPAASRSQREMWEHNQGLRFANEDGNCVPNDKQFLMWNSGFQSIRGLTGKSSRSRAWHRETLEGTYRQSWEMVRNTENSKGCQISRLCCFPGGSDGKASACNVGDPGSIPGSGRSPVGGNGNPLQCSCLENSIDWGAL